MQQKAHLVLVAAIRHGSVLYLYFVLRCLEHPVRYGIFQSESTRDTVRAGVRRGTIVDRLVSTVDLVQLEHGVRVLRLLLVVREILLVRVGRIRGLLFGKIPGVLDVLELPVLRQTVHEIDLVGTIVCVVLHRRLVSPVQRATDHDPRSVHGYLGVGMRLGQPILHAQARNIRFGGTFVLEGDSALVERAPQRLVAGRRGQHHRRLETGRRFTGDGHRAAGAFHGGVQRVGAESRQGGDGSSTRSGVLEAGRLEQRRGTEPQLEDVEAALGQRDGARQRQEDQARDRAEGGDRVPRRPPSFRRLVDQRGEDTHELEARLEGDGDDPRPDRGAQVVPEGRGRAPRDDAEPRQEGDPSQVLLPEAGRDTDQKLVDKRAAQVGEGRLEVGREDEGVGSRLQGG